jgi:hypothetical protein
MADTERTHRIGRDGKPYIWLGDSEPAPRIYRIRRCYAPRFNRPVRTIRGGNNRTLAEAQAHCSDPKTRIDGVYFDCYEYMPGCAPKRDY